MRIFKSHISILMMLCLAASFELAGQSIEDPFGPVHNDSSLIIRWAQNCSVTRGLINISDSSKTDHESNYASLGSASDADGMADGRVVSLGDGGMATYILEPPLSDGPGPDFAVFENGFKEQMPPYLWFLELAVVEVSSDGVNYYRFPAISNTQIGTQVGTFGQSDPAMLYNLAGKYPALYGTPFDLNDLIGATGLDINAITHIRVVDVVGSVNSSYGTADSRGNMINDPWPTPFWSGGFDLDAVAILAQSSSDCRLQIADCKLITDCRLKVFPNPVLAGQPFNIRIEGLPDTQEFQINIFDQSGKSILNQQSEICNLKWKGQQSEIKAVGYYFIIVETQQGRITSSIIVQ